MVLDSIGQADVDTLMSLQTLLRDLQSYLTNVRNGDVTLTDSLTSIQSLQNEIDDKIKKLKLTLPMKQRIDDFWRIVQPLVGSLLQQHTNLADNLSKLKVIDEQLTKTLYGLAQLTVPISINAKLQEEAPGFCINFNEDRALIDLIPNDADRAALLVYIGNEPDLIKCGLVDVQNGRIYRFANNSRDRRIAALKLFVLFLISIAIVAGSTLLNLVNPKTWVFPPSEAPNLVIGWFALLAGVLFHVIVDIQKADQLAFDYFTRLDLTLSAHLPQIIIKIIVALVVFGVVNTLVADKNQLTPVYYLLVGYSLDSFVGIFEQRAGKVTESLPGR
jgi:hypothetical protein